MILASMRTVVVIGLLAATVACYSGNRPPRIGSNAPNFTITDSDHSITLSQFRGNVVLLNFWQAGVLLVWRKRLR